MANTITIESDVTDSELSSNLRAVSPGDTGRFVEVPNQNGHKPTNGGQHRWTLIKATDSKVILYNGDCEAVSLSIRVQTASQPSETLIFPDQE